MMKTAILIGFGGMGKRYYKTLKAMNFEIIAICEKKKFFFDNFQTNKRIVITDNYKKLINFKADILCIASNTGSRTKIIKDFCKKGKIRKILTEKPLATNFFNCLEILKIVKQSRVRLVVNTHRTFSPNYKMVKNIFKQKREKITSFYVNSPSAGLGNMGSTFFDLGLFFLGSKPLSIVGKIDKSNTINPRGKKFKDPGGCGVIFFKDYEKLFFDLSENTGLPYILNIKSENIEIKIDEINNNYEQILRPKDMKKKPLYYYLFKPKKKKLKLKHKFDVVKMTKYSIQQLFNKKFNYKNLEKSIKVMELIFALFVSSKQNKIINLPLKKNYHKININFA
jgi:predicted dehydrogenase